MKTEEELKLEKLQLEIDDLKGKLGWRQKIISLLPFITIIIAILGIWYNFHQFSETQKNQAKTQNDQAEREATSKEMDFRKPFWEKQLSLYFESTNTTSIISTLPPKSPEREKAEERFWQLFHGSLVLVEDEQVMQAKRDFANCLDEVVEECSSEPQKSKTLRDLSIALANSIRSSLGDSWNVPLKNLYIQKKK